MNLLTQETISVLLAGNTVVLRRTDGAEAPVFYDLDGTAYMRHFEHGDLSGPWKTTENGYTVEWNKGVGRMGWTLGYTPGEIAYLDADGAQRAKVLRVEAGDTQSLMS